MVSRLWDTFMFAGEMDMLWFRLAHLKDWAYKHVVVEASQTHRGVPRQFFLAKHVDCCLHEYADRLIIVQAHFPEGLTEPWGREHYQRDAITVALAEHPVGNEDRILVSDVDEIPSDNVLNAELTGPHALRQRIFHSAVDWEYPEPQLTSVIAPAHSLQWPFSLAALRDHRYGLPVIEGAGWHFSWLGTDRERKRKLDERTCHLEMPAEEWRAISDGAAYRHGYHAAPDAQVKAVEVDGTWPEYIRSRRCPPHWFRPR